uniref:ANK_REP_REGION domain-containing protein n=1 Tax=Anopheles albimanus TaxID=7167 RepID=A0A182FKD0_ANOAL
MLDLNELLKPYYYDSFALHKKWDVLKQFLQQRNLAWKENNAKHLIYLDKERLQQLFDERCKDLQQLLQTHGLSTVNNLSERLHDLRSDVRVTIEFSHLELCQMLVAAGYFGDRCSKYQTFLHDPFSYNLLTSSSMQADMMVINAYVIANNEDLRYVKMTEMLLEYKPSLVNARDSLGNTSMHLAAQTGEIEMLEILLKYRANIKLVGCNGSPLAVALQSNRQDFAWRLLAYAVEN